MALERGDAFLERYGGRISSEWYFPKLIECCREDRAVYDACHGFIEATDLNTGKAAWRTYTIPGTGEPGNETWKDGKDRWVHGGASVWVTATYDKDTDTIYQGIGNAGPDYDSEYRPGDNKWAASALALDPNNGKIKWGFQYLSLIHI